MLTVDIKKELHDYTLALALEHKTGCLGILGPSGCGKSMGLKSVAGLVTPDSGLIRLGKTILYSSEGRINLKPKLRKTGYLFQNYALFPNMTVEENVASGISRRDKSRAEKTAAHIHRFQLSGLEKYYPAQLSGGQQQRTALARILAGGPDLLLLDEPFSAMDLTLRESLRLELLQVLKGYGGLSVLVTHDRDEVYQLCDSLIVMEQGRVLCAGPTKEIFEHPGVVQAARLTGCKNISPILRLESHKVMALAWNLQLTTKEAVPDFAAAVGIRPHSLSPLGETDAAALKDRADANLIPAKPQALSDLPFEWEIRLQNSIRWTVRKSLGSAAPPPLPPWFRVDPADLFLLA